MFTALRGGTLQAVYGYGGYWGGQMDLAVLESGIPMAWTSLAETKELWQNVDWAGYWPQAMPNRESSTPCRSSAASSTC
ncbi:hypothetical protein DSL92_01415 [Billgrantia gudaonensis]|uniref:Uncharacterized protein n=1 Tax=Billgrantia gudaonensis TaxID=376427 RepID=A0A3S0VT70_9GAMM|nr:hypothetical protein DSL92_01415 [Halomonas gudaonensis]